MRFSFMACPRRGNCPTPAITSVHGKQKVPREIHPRTAHRSSGELHQHRRRAALLTDSLVRRHPRSYRPQAQAVRHRLFAFQAGSPEQGKAVRLASCPRARPSCAAARLTTATAARPAPGAARERVPYVCEACGIEAEWNGGPIILHVDHINGDWLDNRKQNLRFLCPTVTRRLRHSRVD